MRNTGLIWLLAVTLSAGTAWAQVESPPQQEATQQETADDPERLVEDPYDFSQPPAIPEFDAPSQIEIQQSIDRGIDFLIGCQRETGAWGAATNTKDLNIYAPIPGAHDAFRMATTSMCVTALLETGADNEDVQACVDKAEAWLLEQLPTLRRATSDAIYNCWGHAYAIPALLALRQREGISDEKVEQINELVKLQLEMLDAYESVDGGWGYYDFRYGGRKPTSDSTSFLNATVLVTMHRAQAAGFELNQRTVDRAIAATIRQRKPDFTYLYGEYLKNKPMMGINRPGGSLGRSQACNVALRMFGDEEITDNVLRHWLVKLYERNGWLDMGRKRPVPHESWMAVAGYFYYYGHYYAAHCIEQLPADDRGPYQGMLARLMLDRQEQNGCWWDYPLYDYHQQYGTAYALMTLQRCFSANR
ncbi:MAG: prenyltransferase/squalene oxidase repeat-containing protein [Pirellulaceae bacterium]